ncbi:MAG: NAD-dependent epimerase/dehydratase family protein [Bacteroidetes bacterium]|nr:NAD-dependent epimerase/dehydratase family protein [Bacteroidota bacterium]
MKKILITGVAGFIGSNLAARLLAEGCHITGIDNMSYGEERNIAPLRLNKGFTFVYGDITNPLLLKDYKADIIVHLASQKIPRYSNALKTLDENYTMLKNVVNKCLIDKCKVMYASTSDVYGKNNNLPFTEESDLVLGHPAIKRWAYALSKIYGEQYIIANHEEYSMEFTIARLFGSYGPNHNLTWWGGPQSVFIAKAFRNEPLEIHGDGSQTRTFTYVDDTVEALMHCILHEKSKNEIFNVGSRPDEEISILDLGKLIWKLVNGPGAEPKTEFIPYRTFGKYEDVPRRVPCIDKISSFFGYEPKVSLEEGLRRTIWWQRSL